MKLHARPKDVHSNAHDCTRTFTLTTRTCLYPHDARVPDACLVYPALRLVLNKLTNSTDQAEPVSMTRTNCAICQILEVVSHAVSHDNNGDQVDNYDDRPSQVKTRTSE